MRGESETEDRRTALDATPLRGRYLVRNPVWNLYLRGCDALLGALVGSGPRAAPPPPRRLLLAVGGQIGDAVIAAWDAVA